MVLKSRGQSSDDDKKMQHPSAKRGGPINVPQYKGEFGWDKDEKVLDNIEMVIEEFIKVLESPDIDENSKKMSAVTATALIKAALERREKNKDR